MTLTETEEATITRNSRISLGVVIAGLSAAVWIGSEVIAAQAITNERLGAMATDIREVKDNLKDGNGERDALLRQMMDLERRVTVLESQK